MDLGRLVTADQCEYGAVVSGELVRKSTQFFTNLSDVRVDSRCTGNHSHRQLAGKVGSADRTAIAAVYPEALCTSIFDSIIASTRCCAGGRSTVDISQLGPLDSHNIILTEVLKGLGPFKRPGHDSSV